MRGGRRFAAGIGLLGVVGLCGAGGCASSQAAWRPLFNGQNLEGWTEIGSVGAWSVEDGVLQCSGEHTKYAWLSTDRTYGDFILSFDWRIEPGVNAGVFCRVPQHEGRASMTGFEVQIVDNAVMEKANEKCGSIFARAAAAPGVCAPPGQWNHYEISCRGRHVTVVVNGVTAIDLDMDTIESMRDVPNEGYIGLQNHGDPVEFRNVKIRELPQSPGE
jgi:hypothetical protein